MRGLGHRTMAELSRRHGALMFLRLGEVPTLVVSSAEAAELVMKTHDLAFCSRPTTSVTIDIVGCKGMGLGFAPYGDRWRQMKKIVVMELLSAAQVKRIESIMAEEVGRLLRSVAAAGAGVVNMSDEVKALAPDLVARAMFGGMCAEKSDFVVQYDEVSKLVSGFFPVDLFPSSRLVRWLSIGERRLVRSYGRIQHIIATIIQSRKSAKSNGACSPDQEDLLGVMLRLQEEDSLTFPLTSEIIGAVMFDIFGGATTTIGSTLEWAMSELMKKPEAMEKAQQEVRKVLGGSRGVITNAELAGLNYMRMVIKEVLRLHPPNPLLVPRESREDCEILGYHIPKGTKVLVNAFAISRDPRYWNNPEDFNPERFEHSNIDYKGTNFEFTPFGAGRRQCPAIMFGTSTFEIAMANLLYHFDWVLPDGVSPEMVDMSEKYGMGVSKKFDLHLRAIPYVHSSVA
ncbi:Premnaspirodiene oxygenase [Dichanthelium oligosanthes]|uniref:Premnaspirodiene oxygenase n=1 Tax=Dichanthelium oligosanthes TaxID=888268 RepID=A0A1E5WE60_9POAL|nr:Premnaspirodiene oxygenase [Dichanthelium oligosanthes]